MGRHRNAYVLSAFALVLSLEVARADVPCAEDMRTLCKGVAAGGGRIQQCLKDNEAKLSEACRKRLDGLAAELKTAAVVCRYDLGRLCSDAVPGSGRAISCLKQNQQDLSPECKHQLEGLKE